MADNLDVTPGSGATVSADLVGGVLYQRVHIGRFGDVETLTIGLGTAITSTELDMAHYSGGVVIVPAVWDAANIGFTVSPTSGGTFVILRDYLGTPVQISGIETAGSRAYSLPMEIFGCGFIKLWSKSLVTLTETDVNQAASRTLTVILKG